MGRQIIQTNRAPQAIGPYSQAVRAGDTVYLSGQIPLDPDTMQLVTGDIEAEIRRVFDRSWLYLGHESEVNEPGATLRLRSRSTTSGPKDLARSVTSRSVMPTTLWAMRPGRGRAAGRRSARAGSSGWQLWR